MYTQEISCACTLLRMLWAREPRGQGPKKGAVQGLCVYKRSLLYTQEISCVYTRESLVLTQEISCVYTRDYTRDSLVYTQEISCAYARESLVYTQGILLCTQKRIFCVCTIWVHGYNTVGSMYAAVGCMSMKWLGACMRMLGACL